MEEKNKNLGKSAVRLGIIVGVFLIAGKLLLGVLGRSTALIADAIHSITDFITDIFAWLGLHFAYKKEDREHPFGHGKIDSMMSFLIGLSMVIAGFWLGYEAIIKMYHGEFLIPNQLALWGAGISIVIKEGLFHYTVRIGKKINNQSLIANAWHHRSDAFSSLAVLLGIIPGLYSPDLAIFDSIAAIVVSLMIVKAGYDVIAPAYKSTIDTGPDQMIVDQIEKVASAIEGVHNVHDIKGRYYSNKLYLEIHIVVDPEITVAAGHLISVNVRSAIKVNVDDILDIIIHVDPDEEEWNQPRITKD